MARVLICVSLLAVIAAVPAARQQPTFRSTAENVPVFVTVTDKSGRLVTGLERDAFQVFDNGKAQPITLFDNRPQPVRIVVLLDVSGSMAGNLPLLREATRQLIAHLDPDDRARIGTFGDEVEISPTFTNDEETLLAALPKTIEPDAPTPLWEAVDRGIRSFSGAEDGGGRRVVLVLSDGKDSGPRFGHEYLTQLEVGEHAQNEDVMIYGVGMRSRTGRGPVPSARGGLPDPRAFLTGDMPDPGLGTVALDSGGGYFELQPRDDAGAAFARVADELHQQYLVGFTPASRDGKVHKLDVKLTTKDMKPRARKTYRAPKAGT
jgi:Ca-activated chloride channel family protein